MPKHTANPDGKRIAATARTVAAAKGFDIAVHRRPYADCPWTGRDVFYRDGLMEAGLSLADAQTLVNALEAEVEAERIKGAAARGYRWASHANG